MGGVSANINQILTDLKTNPAIIKTGLVISVLVAVVLTGCNKKDDYIYSLPTSATVRSFSLSNDKKVLNNLDSVFFSIDLYSFEIFNADSLPFGTKVNKLVPVIETESASVVDLTYRLESGKDTTVNYLENTTDTICFTHPVKMKVVSYDGSTECNYTIRVNVHQVPTDTLVWKRLEQSGLPTVFRTVSEQHTSMAPGGMYFCMTRYQENYCIAYTDNPDDVWTAAETNLGFEANVNTFTATKNALYVTDTSANLYKSEDNGATWESAGARADYILGAYGNRLLITCNENDTWYIAEYPSGTKTISQADFPVLNTSNSTTVSFDMSVSEQMFVTGGRKADGTLSNATWGFDGSSWVKVSRYGMSEGLENMALVPYFDVQPDTISWRVKKPTSVLFAMYGNRVDGTSNDTVYVSKNFGMSWTKAPESLQIPTSVIPSRTLAQAYPYVGKSYADSSKLKNKFSHTKSLIPEWESVQWVDDTLRKNSPWRVSAPITEWEVPYIYLFGGVSDQGMTFNTVFRGVITAFTFKPIE